MTCWAHSSRFSQGTLTRGTRVGRHSEDLVRERIAFLGSIGVQLPQQVEAVQRDVFDGIPGIGELGSLAWLG